MAKKNEEIERLDFEGLEYYDSKLKKWAKENGVTGLTKEEADKLYSTKEELKNIKAVAGSNIGETGTPSVSVELEDGNPTFTFNYLKGKQGDKGEKGDTGSPGSNGTDGVTPTLKIVQGTNFGSVGTPSATVTQDGTIYTITLNYMKGATGSPGTNATTTSVATTSSNGLMSSTDKTNLNTLVNWYNSFSSNDGATYGIKNRAAEIIALSGRSVVDYDPTATAALLALQTGYLPTGLSEEDELRVRELLGEEIWGMLEEAPIDEEAQEEESLEQRLESAKAGFLERMEEKASRDDGLVDSGQVPTTPVNPKEETSDVEPSKPETV